MTDPAPEKAPADLLARLRTGSRLLPAEAAQFIASIFETSRYAVIDRGFIEGDSGVDLQFRTERDGRQMQFTVDFKFGTRKVGEAVVGQALYMASQPPIDRALVVSAAGFSEEAIRRANTEGVGKVDLLGLDQLQNWLSSLSAPAPVQLSCEFIIRRAMKDLAIRLADHPEELPQVEWRDLERLLRETFEGIGFDTILTRAAKDDGFDLELTATIDGTRQTFLVEVKHWLTGRPGADYVKKLISVTASRRAAGGLILSTSGFTTTLYSGLAEFSTASVRLGDGQKVIGLCRTFYRIGSPLWTAEADLRTALYLDTKTISDLGSP